MGYQALLFCPDEKTARTVTQVLSELDFTVVPCTEPFAAVKKLMGEHFDAVVVDCRTDVDAVARTRAAAAAQLAVHASLLAVAGLGGRPDTLIDQADAARAAGATGIRLYHAGLAAEEDLAGIRELTKAARDADPDRPGGA